MSSSLLRLSLCLVYNPASLPRALLASSNGLRVNIPTAPQLLALRQRQLAGEIRSSAEVAVVLDEGASDDAWTYRKLEDAGWMSWNASYCVAQHELQACTAHASLARSKSGLHICGRSAQAKFRLSVGRLSDVHQGTSASHLASQRCTVQAPPPLPPPTLPPPPLPIPPPPPPLT